jgi:nucleoside-diphosphate-sugar epimerase
MKALVTGATGFLGNHLTLELRRQGWEVVCAVRGQIESRDPGIRCVAFDLTRPEPLDPNALAGGADVMFHLAAAMPATGREPDCARFLLENACATTRLLASANKIGIGVFVYASGLAIVGKPEKLPIREDHPVRPLHPYLVGKAAGELACEMERLAAGSRVASLRITSPYGAGMPVGSVLPLFVRRALASEDLTWHGTGERSQNFVHARDVVNAFLLAANAGTGHSGIYNVGHSRSICMRDLAKLVVLLTPGSTSEAKASALPDPQDSFRFEVDLSKSAVELGYTPQVDLESGLAEYIDAARSGTPAPTWWTRR